jgi:hypothetical protein
MVPFKQYPTYDTMQNAQRYGNYGLRRRSDPSQGRGRPQITVATAPCSGLSPHPDDDLRTGTVVPFIEACTDGSDLAAAHFARVGRRRPAEPGYRTADLLAPSTTSAPAVPCNARRITISR